ncbi:MAG: hypothetical protein ACRDQ7_18910 [Haloechinothrix sp.]
MTRAVPLIMTSRPASATTIPRVGSRPVQRGRCLSNRRGFRPNAVQQAEIVEMNTLLEG